MTPPERQDLGKSWTFVERRDLEQDRILYSDIASLSLPSSIIDAHTHSGTEDLIGEIPLDRLLHIKTLNNRRSCPVPELQKLHTTIFPNKTVDSITFPFPYLETDITRANTYLLRETTSSETMFALGNPLHINQTMDLITEHEPVVRGVKAYYDQIPKTETLDPEEGSIYQFFPKELLSFLNNRSLPIMLHVPRTGGIGNLKTLQEVKEIASHFPKISVILAHMGRCYNPYDFEGVITDLSPHTNIYFESSMVDESKVFEIALQHIGPQRLLFGTDLPLSQVRFLRVLEGKKQITLSKQESYAMRIPQKPNVAIGMNVLYMTKALLQACNTCHISPEEKEYIFRNNALRLIS